MIGDPGNELQSTLNSNDGFLAKGLFGMQDLRSNHGLLLQFAILLFSIVIFSVNVTFAS